MRSVTLVSRLFTNGNGRVGRGVACETCDSVEVGGRTGSVGGEGSSDCNCYKGAGQKSNMYNNNVKLM